MAKQNNIFRINIFNQNGQNIFSSHTSSHTGLPEKNSPIETLRPIFTGKLDTLFIGLKPARFEDGYRFAVAIAADDRSAIVVNIDAEQMMNQRKQTGFGALIREIVSNPGIV